MNDVMTTARLLAVVNQLSQELGPDATLRQVAALLHIGQASHAGIDGVTLEKKTDSSQAATSRTFKLLSQTHGLVEFFLDQADGRRRLARLTGAGNKLLAKLARLLQQ